MRRRREFLAQLTAAGLASCGGSPVQKKAPPKKTPVLLLRSGWNSAGTAGMLRLIEHHFSDIRVILWSNDTDRGVTEILQRHYPQVQIVSGEPVSQAFQQADFLLHGSGASLVARGHVETWRKSTGKPYGFLGVTITGLDDGLRQLLEGSAFVYTRETASLNTLKNAGIRGPAIGFAPDAAFSLKLSNDQDARPLLEKHGLEPKKFIVVIPGQNPSAIQEAVTAWARRTGNKVLLPPDPLPPDVASSVYRRAVSVLSVESSPAIIAAVNDTPGLCLVAPDDHITKQMWTDIGLGQWVLSGGDITEALMKIHANYDASQVDVHEAVIYARSRQSEAMEHLRKVIVR